jgi:DNA polymerase-3 subunit gamma/tau
MASELARNCELAGWDGQTLRLTLDPECENLQVGGIEDRLRTALEQSLGIGLKLVIQASRTERETPAQRQVRHQAERQAGAEALMEQDPVVQSLREEFDARWVAGSIEPA